MSKDMLNDDELKMVVGGEGDNSGDDSNRYCPFCDKKHDGIGIYGYHNPGNLPLYRCTISGNNFYETDDAYFDSNGHTLKWKASFYR